MSCVLSVTTITNAWWRNICDGIFGAVDNNGQKMQNQNGASIPAEFDYWCNNWIPQKPVDEIAVFHLGALVIIGDIEGAFRELPKKIYSSYKATPQSIGLPVNMANSFQDFSNLLSLPFHLVPNALGNLIFKPTYIANYVSNVYKGTYHLNPNLQKANQQHLTNIINTVTQPPANSRCAYFDVP